MRCTHLSMSLLYLLGLVSLFELHYMLQRGLTSAANRPNESTPYHIGALICNRVYKEDRFKVTAFECKQWIEYMLYAGVEHIFWYDAAHGNDESQELQIKSYVLAGSLTYHRFHHLFPGHERSGYHFEQDNSYRHFMAHYRARTKWLVVIDIDEYPFSPSDLRPGFLDRLVSKFDDDRPDVSQMLLSCVFFEGNPRGDLLNGWMIEKYQRRKQYKNTPESLWRLKPIIRVELCAGVLDSNPHRFPMLVGKTQNISPNVMRLNHYWGARMTDFGPDTADVLKALKPDKSIQPLVFELKRRVGSMKTNST